jgi:hypothetical protein
MTTRVITKAIARAAFRRESSLLHPEYPIEQTLRGADATTQAQLLQEIWRQHAYVDHAALLIAEPTCVRVLARSEAALRPAVDGLRHRYGSSLVVEPAMVRYMHGAPVLEPLMVVLASGPLRDLPVMQGELRRRRATLTRIARTDPFVLEAEASLGQLLGYGDWLDARFHGAVDVSVWLSRYGPIDDDPYAA